MDKITVQSIQIALFLKDSLIKNEFDKAKLLLDLRDNLTVFDGNPIQVPIPIDLPTNISVPFIILNSLDKTYSCNISQNRVDFFHKLNTESKFEDVYIEIEKKLLQIFSFFKNKSEINRVGFVVNNQFETNKNVDFLVDKYLVKDKFLKTKEVLLRHVSEDIIETIGINKTITLSGKKDSNLIQVQIDINTFPNQASDFSIAEDLLKKFLAGTKIKVLDFLKDFNYGKQGN